MAHVNHVGTYIEKAGTYHCETESAPSIHDVELKNMPWWWRVMGSSMPLIAWTSKSSVDWTSIGGGLEVE